MDDYYSVATEATDHPVTLKEAKEFVRQDGDADDVLITALIKAATDQAELFTGRCFVQRTITGQFAGLDSSRCERYPFLKFRRGPLVSITSFQSMVDDSLTDVPATSYQLKQTNGYSRLLIVDAISADDVPYPLVVVGVIGYGKPKFVPESIKDGIKCIIAFMYENRGDVASDMKGGIPLEAKSYLGKYKIIDTF